MINASEVLGVQEVLTQAGDGDLTEEKLSDVASAVFSSDSGRDDVKEVLEGWSDFSKKCSPAGRGNVLLGFVKFILGDLTGAEEVLRKEKRQEWGYYYLIKATLARGGVEEAARLVTDARSKFQDFEQLIYLAVDVYCRARRHEDAQKLLEKYSGLAETSPNYACAQAQHLESMGEYGQAIEWYRRAVEREPDHSEAFFRLAYLLDLHGEGDATDAAIQAYEMCVKVSPVHANAAINLGLLYEDKERYHDAIKCYETVLNYYPQHDRARLFLEDSRAATTMFYDKEQEKKADRHSQVLKIPVTDFELSVRSRNCLHKMNIDTLGDLITKSEQELLSYKNFGETSLKEIKDMLGQKGLRLGQGVESQKGEFPSSRNPLEATVSQETLDQPIDTLNLSIRSRRCMDRLEINTLRVLINKTEVELMAAKNFGMTSLNEIKRKLGEMGMSLRS